MTTVERVIADIIGELCWGVSPGAFEWNLKADFGEPHLSIREPRESSSESEAVRNLARHRRVDARGRWHLLTWWADWDISENGGLLADSDSDEEAVLRATNLLSGQRLVEAHHDLTAAVTTLSFDLGGQLVLRRPNECKEDATLWDLFLPEGMVLSVRADGAVAHEPGDLGPDQKNWLG